MAVTPRPRIGIAGNLSVLLGTFTHTGAAAEETLVVDGVPYGAMVITDSSSEVVQANPCVISTSLSGFKNTITFHYQSGVAAGKFIVFLGHGG